MKALLASVVLAGFAALPAFAQSSDDPVSVSVSYADLDLGHEAGRAQLERRVKAAVERVCPRLDMRDPLSWQNVASECRAAAKKSVQAQLASLYERRDLAQGEIKIAGSGR